VIDTTVAAGRQIESSVALAEGLFLLSLLLAAFARLGEAIG
jgi:hypothetical protein